MERNKTNKQTNKQKPRSFSQNTQLKILPASGFNVTINFQFSMTLLDQTNAYCRSRMIEDVHHLVQSCLQFEIV